MTILSISSPGVKQYLCRTSADAEEAIEERDPLYQLPAWRGPGDDSATVLDSALTPGEVVRATVLRAWVSAGMTTHQALARMSRMGY